MPIRASVARGPQLSHEGGARVIVWRPGAAWLSRQYRRVGPPDQSHEHALGSFVKNVEQKFIQFNTAALLFGIQTDSGLPTAVSSPSLKLAEVASSSATLLEG